MIIVEATVSKIMPQPLTKKCHIRSEEQDPVGADGRFGNLLLEAQPTVLGDIQVGVNPADTSPCTKRGTRITPWQFVMVGDLWLLILVQYFAWLMCRVGAMGSIPTRPNGRLRHRILRSYIISSYYCITSVLFFLSTIIF